MIELIRRREVLWAVAGREIAVKYKQTILGFLWAILMPMIVISAGLAVKYAASILSERPLDLAAVASVSVKSVPWAFFVSGIRFATTSLVRNVALVTKIYMPREIFPIASILSQLVDFAVASAVLAAVLAAARIGLSPHLLWTPLLVIVLILFTAGLGIMFSAASLFFRDVKYIVEALLTFAIFFTPVFFETELFGRWGTLLLLNPVAPPLEALNDCIVRQRAPDIGWVLYSAVVSAGAFVISLVLFKRLEPAFAESI